MIKPLFYTSLLLSSYIMVIIKNVVFVVAKQLLGFTSFFSKFYLISTACNQIQQ